VNFYSRFVIRTLLVSSMAMSASIIGGTAAQAAIKVTVATITAGKLSLSGTATASSVITLDGGIATAKTGSGGNFTFGTALAYVPHRCVVKLTSSGQPTVLAKVANCSPVTLNIMDDWLSTQAYITDDIVFYGGTSWRAKQPVPANIIPSLSADIYWQPFGASPVLALPSAGGATGLASSTDQSGATGTSGVIVAGGTTAVAGPTGTDGATGATGPTGSAAGFGATFISTALSSGTAPDYEEVAGSRVTADINSAALVTISGEFVVSGKNAPTCSITFTGGSQVSASDRYAMVVPLTPASGLPASQTFFIAGQAAGSATFQLSYKTTGTCTIRKLTFAVQSP